MGSASFNDLGAPFPLAQQKRPINKTNGWDLQHKESTGNEKSSRNNHSPIHKTQNPTQSESPHQCAFLKYTSFNLQMDGCKKIYKIYPSLISMQKNNNANHHLIHSNKTHECNPRKKISLFSIPMQELLLYNGGITSLK